MHRAIWMCLVMATVPTSAWSLSAQVTRSLCEEVPASPHQPDEATAQAAIGEALFAARQDPAKAREAIGAWERSLATDGSQTALRIKLARLYFLVADGYERLAGNDDAVVDGLQKGMAHAGIALGQTNPAFKRKVCSGAPLAQAVATLDRASVPAAYWFAAHVSQYGRTRGVFEWLANKEMVCMVLETIRRLQPDYFYFAPDRDLGSYYSKTPLPKGDLDKALTCFLSARHGAPQYFATNNLIAELYAPNALDTIDPRATRCRAGSPKIGADAPMPRYHPCRALFLEALQGVLESKNELPEIAAEQALEQERAKRLVKELDRFFAPMD